MININFFNNFDGLLLGFEIYGHADYDVLGKDIVCAAVSSAAFLVANTIVDVIKVSVDLFINEDGTMRLKVDPIDERVCRDLLLGFKIHILNLEEQYPKCIKVNYMEVN